MKNKNLIVALMLSVAFFACKVVRKITQYRPEYSLAYHYPGSTGIMDNDTYKKLEKAIAEGVTTIILPVAITSDNKPIVALIASHNDFKKIYTKKSIEYDYTLPFLNNTINNLFAYAQKLNKHIKIQIVTQNMDYVLEDKVAPFIYSVSDLISQSSDTMYTKHVYIASDDREELRLIHQRDRKIITAYYYHPSAKNTLEREREYMGYFPDYFIVNSKSLTDLLFDELFQNKIFVVADSVNDANKYMQLRKKSIDGIITSQTSLFKLSQ